MLITLLHIYVRYKLHPFPFYIKPLPSTHIQIPLPLTEPNPQLITLVPLPLKHIYPLYANGDPYQPSSLLAILPTPPN